MLEAEHKLVTSGELNKYVKFGKVELAGLCKCRMVIRYTKNQLENESNYYKRW